MEVRPLLDGERPWMVEVLADRWGGRVVVARGDVIDLGSLSGLVASGDGGEAVGLLTYRVDYNSLEVVTLDALEPCHGAGSALLARAMAIAREADLWRVWLVTTNDNLDAIAFYLRQGMRLVTVHQNAVNWSRQVKPSIPLVGSTGIAIEDEIELEIVTGGEGPPPRRRR
jgi:ribosomal protein S18 acetylase RimI-like enzyme